jgi:hypothetical protein
MISFFQLVSWLSGKKVRSKDFSPEFLSTEVLTTNPAKFMTIVVVSLIFVVVTKFGYELFKELSVDIIVFSLTVLTL